MVLKKVPDFPARLTVTESTPLVSGAKIQGVLGNLATVQPQEVCTRSICTGTSNGLVTLKENSAVNWPGSGVCSLRIESHWSESSSGGLGGATWAVGVIGPGGKDVAGGGACCGVGGAGAGWAKALVPPSSQARVRKATPSKKLPINRIVLVCITSNNARTIAAISSFDEHFLSVIEQQGEGILQPDVSWSNPDGLGYLIGMLVRLRTQLKSAVSVGDN